MIQRKAYTTYAEEKQDQRRGFVCFPLVNIMVGIILWLLPNAVGSGISLASARSTATFLPWVINGLIILWALIFRFQFSVGYLVALAGFAALGVGLGLIGVVTYFISVPLQALAGLIGFGVFLVLALAASIWFLVKMFGLLKGWWAI